MWWHTEQRAKGDRVKGVPTLEQLVFGRRHELIEGDHIAAACSASRVRNLMISVTHPRETVIDLINHTDPRIVYLSFPISEPRRMSLGNDETGVNEINAFIRTAYQYQHQNDRLVIQCPLGIDELPLRTLIDSCGDEEYVNFDRATARWNLEEIWPIGERLAEPTVKPHNPISCSQLCDAAGNIFTDVTFRDYRLVEQSDCLAVFNPVFYNEISRRKDMSRSVLNEIEFAVSLGKRVYVYQDDARDPDGVVNDRIGPVGGTMANSPGSNRKMRLGSPDELFQAILAY